MEPGVAELGRNGTIGEGGIKLAETLGDGSTFIRGELMAMVIEKPMLTDVIEPTVLLVETEDGVRKFLGLKSKLHTEVGLHVKETGSGDGVGATCGMLTIIISAGGEGYLTTVQVVQSCGVIVAVKAAGSIVGITQVNVATHSIDAMQTPVETEQESIVTRDDFVNATGQLKGVLLVGVLQVPFDVQHHTIYPIAKAGNELGEAVGREPVVGIQHHNNLPLGMLQCQVTCHCLSLVGGLTENLNAGILKGILLKNLQRGVGAGIIHTDELPIWVTLFQDGINGLMQVGRGIINRHQDGDAG